MNNITPEKVQKGKTSKMPPAKKWDGDAQEMLNVGYVKMPGFTLNLNDRSKLFEDGCDNNVKQALSKFALQYTTVTFGLPIDCSSRLLQYSACRGPIFVPRPVLESLDKKLQTGLL